MSLPGTKTDDAARKAMLARVWAPAGQYRDPTAHVRGRAGLAEHIGGFQVESSGSAIARSGAVQTTGAEFYFGWEMVDGDGTAIVTGKDAGVLDVDGKILSIRGFFDAPDRGSSPG